MEDLTLEEKSKILKQYLKDFAVYFNDEEEILFKNSLKELDNALIKSNDYNLLKKAICFILLSLNTKIRYIFLKSNDIIDAMLEDNIDSEEYNFYDIQNIPLLIIYHPKLWKKNKILWETLNYLLDTRLNNGKQTIIITDSTRISDEHGSLNPKNIINLDSNNNGVVIVKQSSNDNSIYDD